MSGKGKRKEKLQSIITKASESYRQGKQMGKKWTEKYWFEKLEREQRLSIMANIDKN